MFVGERVPLTENGIRGVCEKHSAISGGPFTPHTLRNTFAHRYLDPSGNDLVGLAQILGHENLNTAAIYTRRGEEQLQEAVETMPYS